MPVRDGLLDLRAITAKALGKILPPTAAAPHFQKIIRGADYEKDRKKEVIQKSHHLLAGPKEAGRFHELSHNAATKMEFTTLTRRVACGHINATIIKPVGHFHVASADGGLLYPKSRLVERLA
jgi:hypothetical protein